MDKIDDVWVSVIIPTFNAAQTVRASISSVLAQNHKYLEIIVVDDASTDGTADLVEDYSQTLIDIRCIRLPENSGTPAKPRNVGVAHARFDVIAFLDADDAWDPCHLETSLQTMQDHSCALVTSCIMPSGSVGYTSSSCRESSAEISLASLFWTNSVVTSSVVLKRQGTSTPLRFPEGFNIYEDYAQWLVLTADTPFRSTGCQSISYSSSGVNRMSLRRTRPLITTFNTFRYFMTYVDDLSLGRRVGLMFIALLSLGRVFAGEVLRGIRHSTQRARTVDL